MQWWNNVVELSLCLNTTQARVFCIRWSLLKLVEDIPHTDRCSNLVVTSLCWLKLRNGRDKRNMSMNHDYKTGVATKLCETPPNGGLTMMSYPVCNKTSLPRKPCITAEELLWNAIRKSWSLFQNPACKIACSTPWWRTDDDVISGWQSNLGISETMYGI